MFGSSWISSSYVLVFLRECPCNKCHYLHPGCLTCSCLSVPTYRICFLFTFFGVFFIPQHQLLSCLFLPICLYVCLSVCLSVSFSLFFTLSIYLSIYLYLFKYISVIPILYLLYRFDISHLPNTLQVLRHTEKYTNILKKKKVNETPTKYSPDATDTTTCITRYVFCFMAGSRFIWHGG